MLKTYLYIPELLEDKIKFTAKTLKKSKAEIMRHALERGIFTIQQQSTASADALAEIASIGRKNNLKGLPDGSENMDDYLWNSTHE